MVRRAKDSHYRLKDLKHQIPLYALAGTLNPPAYTEEDKGGILAAALHRHYSRLRNMELMEAEALEVVCTGSGSGLVGIVDAIPSHRQRTEA